jgi:hypothetical protein
MASLDVVDSQDCFESSTIKWKKHSASIMGFGHNTCEEWFSLQGKMGHHLW